MHRHLDGWALIGGLLLGCLGAASAQAQSPEAFFKDKTIKIMVGHSAGGGFDAYARLAAEMLKKHLPGVAGTVVEVLVDNGRAVEFGEALFRLRPSR